MPPRSGARCTHHPEREAVVHCVVCDRDVCFSCFFPDLGRCQRCVEDRPEEVAAPIPFESVGMVRGFLPSVAMAFAPRKTGPSFAIGDSLVRPAIFFLLTFVPLAALRGIIPYTHRIHFGPMSKLVIASGSSRHALFVDVVRAMGVSFVECSAQLLAFAVCYVSLASAFGRSEARTIGLRTLAYRAFLLPIGGVFGILPTLCSWLGPTVLSQADAVVAIGALPMFAFYLAVHRSARAVGRVDLFPGLAVVGVPFALWWLAGNLVFDAMIPLLPPEFRG